MGAAGRSDWQPAHQPRDLTPVDRVVERRANPEVRERRDARVNRDVARDTSRRAVQLACETCLHFAHPLWWWAVEGVVGATLLDGRHLRGSAGTESPHDLVG